MDIDRLPVERGVTPTSADLAPQQALVRLPGMSLEQARQILGVVVITHEDTLTPLHAAQGIQGYNHREIRTAFWVMAEDLFRQEDVLDRSYVMIEKRVPGQGDVILNLTYPPGNRRLGLALYHPDGRRVLDARIPIEGQPRHVDHFIDITYPDSPYTYYNLSGPLDIRRNWRGARWTAASLLSGFNPFYTPKELDRLSLEEVQRQLLLPSLPGAKV